MTNMIQVCGNLHGAREETVPLWGAVFCLFENHPQRLRHLRVRGGLAGA